MLGQYFKPTRNTCPRCTFTIVYWSDQLKLVYCPECEWVGTDDEITDFDPNKAVTSGRT